MKWIKRYTKEIGDLDAKIAAKLYHEFLKDGEKKDAIGNHYRSVIGNGNNAEKEISEIIEKELSEYEFSCVANIRIDGKYSEDNWAAEFDFILEDKSSIIYINTKYSDYSNNRETQILRHTKILKRIIPNGKSLKVISVITTDEKSKSEFIKKLKELVKEFCGEDNCFCNILSDLHKPITHEKVLCKQFGITQNDFKDYIGYQNYVKSLNVDYEVIHINSEVKNVINRLNMKDKNNKQYKTDIIEIDDMIYKQVYIPVGKAKQEFIGKLMYGRFRKEFSKKPPYITENDFENDFKIEE